MAAGGGPSGGHGPGELERPIVLLGTHRSGTTWMGDLLKRLPGVAYYEEPRHVWMWGREFHPDDELGPEHATPRAVSAIRTMFASYVQECGATRLAEKTPSNCLRVPFIHAVYPHAKLIFIVRDGRSVIRSTAEIMRGGLNRGRVWARIKGTPLHRWPAYVPMAVRTLGRRVLKRPMRYWGPKPAGWKHWLAAGDSEAVILAKQWSATVMKASRDLKALDAASLARGQGPAHVRLRYEDLAVDLRGTLARVLAFAEIQGGEGLIEAASSSFDAARVDAWREELDSGVLEEIRPHMAEAMAELGYAW